MMKRWIRGWPAQAVCGGHHVAVFFVLPDTFFDAELFTCMGCGEIFCFDREHERYGGARFEVLCGELTCPGCGASLDGLVAYPATFRCPNGEEGHFELPRTYPPDEEMVLFQVWDIRSEFPLRSTKDYS